MRRITTDCESLRDAQRKGEAKPSGPPATGSMQLCVTASSINSVTTLESGGMSTAQLATWLARNAAGRPVIDRTGLQGYFEITVQFAREQSLNASPVNSTDPAAAPTLAAALESQLGLKLDAIRELMEVLVIDRAEMPTPN